MSNVTEVVESYLAAWNERDARRRREVLAKAWSEDGSYVDPHRSGQGYDAISAMIAAVQEQLPGYRLRLASAVDAHANRARFTWEAGGTPDAPLHFVGTDFAILSEDGRLKSVTGFVDEAPNLKK